MLFLFWAGFSMMTIGNPLTVGFFVVMWAVYLFVSWSAVKSVISYDAILDQYIEMTTKAKTDREIEEIRISFNLFRASRPY
jgi:lipopolysaccharide export LptBFGC system permease protein LptF